MTALMPFTFDRHWLIGSHRENAHRQEQRCINTLIEKQCTGGVKLKYF